MENKRRLFKQAFIAIIYLVIFSGIGIGGYFLFRPTPVPLPPPAPTVYPIETIWSQAFQSGQGVYSVAAKIRNPNIRFGSSYFTYTFYLYDASGNLLATKAGQSFIWPGESKHIIELGISSEKTPIEIKLQLGEPTWKEINNFGGIDLTIGNINYGREKMESGKFFSVNFTATNGTSYDLSKVFVSAVIFDGADKPIAVNSTVLENLRSQERRPYSIPWFSAFPGSPSRVDLSISTNIWDRPELLGQ